MFKDRRMSNEDVHICSEDTCSLAHVDRGAAGNNRAIDVLMGQQASAGVESEAQGFGGDSPPR
jgi:hypothetical protein